MSVWILSRGFELTDALRAHAERRLRLAVARFRTRVRSLILRVDDVNGPRGGDDKRCQITARLAPRGEVRVEELNSDLYSAIGRGADRLKRAVARATERRLRRRGLSAPWREGLRCGSSVGAVRGVRVACDGEKK